MGRVRDFGQRLEMSAGETEREPSVSEDGAEAHRLAHTRISGYWSAVVVGLAVLVILIVFILENDRRVHVAFLGAHWYPPEGVALLLAAVFGGLVVAVAGVARVLQLRRRHRQTLKRNGARDSPNLS